MNKLALIKISLLFTPAFLMIFNPALALSLTPFLLLIPMLRACDEFLWHKNTFFEEYHNFILPLLGGAIVCLSDIFSMTLFTASLPTLPLISIPLLCIYLGYHILKDSKFYTHSRNDKITLFATIMINALLFTQKILFQDTSTILRDIALIASYYQAIPFLNYLISDSVNILSKLTAKRTAKNPGFDPVKDINPLRDSLDVYFKELHYKKHNPAIKSSKIETLPTPGVFHINKSDQHFFVRKFIDLQDSIPRFEISRNFF